MNNQSQLVSAFGPDDETQMGHLITRDRKGARAIDPDTGLPSGPGSTEEGFPDGFELTEGDSPRQPEVPDPDAKFPSGQSDTDSDAFNQWESVSPQPRHPRKRRELEARFGKSPLYFVLKRYGLLGVYLDRDLAEQAGISHKDIVTFYRDKQIPNRFALAKTTHGWQIKQLSTNSSLLYLSPTISTRYRRVFHSFFFGPDGSVTPTAVRVGEDEGKTFLDFTLPNILPPADLQTNPLILTQAYRDTILNLERSLANEAGIGPGSQIWFGYDSEQYPDELLIYYRDRAHEAYPITVGDRWLHDRGDLGDFNGWFFPKGTIHLTPDVRVGDYSVSPERPPIKLLVASIAPTPGHTWADFSGSLFKPHLHRTHPIDEPNPVPDGHERITEEFGGYHGQ